MMRKWMLVWYGIYRKKVEFVDKMRIFDAVSRSVVCFACQVCGASLYVKVEKLNSWLTKRMLGLPKCSPDYVIY